MARDDSAEWLAQFKASGNEPGPTQGEAVNDHEAQLGLVSGGEQASGALLTRLEAIRASVITAPEEHVAEQCVAAVKVVEVSDEAVWVAARIYNEFIRTRPSHPDAMHAALEAAFRYMLEGS